MKKIMFNDRYGLTQAVLEGKKTMTRRIIKGSYVAVIHLKYEGSFIGKTVDGDSVILPQPTYKIGEEVAVAQSYHELNKRGFVSPEWCEHFCEDSVGYENKMFVRADLMPYRIRITDIQLQRLNNITDEDSLKEGVEKWIDCYIVSGIMENQGKNNVCFDTPRDAFAALIDRISGKGTWQRNPFVYAYTFEMIK